MNYKVLYRKYRPQNFEEVIGQNNTVSLLKDAVENNKISHAYIFSGPRGTGKTSCAKIFAKAINCLCEDEAKPCNRCENCMNFKYNNDVYEIDAASNNGVDQIREIIENIKLAPINSRYKVYIIDEVHMLSTSAFNALLLTLEEPPSHVVFILATTDIEDVPITVLSRCQRLDFKKITSKDIQKNLENIANLEKINIESEAIHEIAEFSDGGMRDALSILDQVSKKEDRITIDTVLSTVGLVSTKSINSLIDSINDNNIDGIIKFINKARDMNADYKTVVKKIINILKNKAINIKNCSENLRISYDDCKNLCFELANSLYKCNVNIDSYSLLELILLDYVSIDNAESSVQMKSNKTVVNIENKEKEMSLSSEHITPSYKNCDDLINIRINNCFVDANKQYLNNAKIMWENFKKTVDDKKLIGLSIDFDVVLSSDKIIVVKTDLEEKADNFNSILNDFENSFNDCNNSNYKLIAVSNACWNCEMDKYKDNLKKGVKYTYLDEPGESSSNMMDDIFVKQKIEVK